MWSTTVAGVRWPFFWHSAHRGYWDRKAFRALCQRASYPRAVASPRRASWLHSLRCPRSRRRCRRGWGIPDSDRDVWAYGAYWPPVPAISADFHDDFARFSAYYQLIRSSNGAKKSKSQRFAPFSPDVGRIALVLPVTEKSSPARRTRNRRCSGSSSPDPMP